MKKLDKILMRLILVTIVIFSVMGCSLTRNTMQDKWGPPFKCEPQGEFTVCYWYFYMGMGSAPDTYTPSPDWKCKEVTFNKNDKVIKIKRYWVQPKLK
jgi:hypothetical protein